MVFLPQPLKMKICNKNNKIKLPPKYNWNFWESICSRFPNLWFCSSIRHIRSAVTWGFLSSSPLSLSTMSRLVMVFKAIYDAFLKYWLVVAIVALSVPILVDKKTRKKQKIHVLYLVCMWLQHSNKENVTNDYFPCSPKVPRKGELI